jgi:hypothetical protein
MAGAGGTAVMSAIVPGNCFMPTSLGAGFERCETGQLHRTSVDGVCSSPLPRDFAFTPDEVDALQLAAIERGLDASALLEILPCAYDVQCAIQPNGYCEATPGGDLLSECRYGCVSDDECDSGSICLCGDPVGTCVPALCDDLPTTLRQGVARSRCYRYFDARHTRMNARRLWIVTRELRTAPASEIGSRVWAAAARYRAGPFW